MLTVLYFRGAPSPRTLPQILQAAGDRLRRSARPLATLLAWAVVMVVVTAWIEPALPADLACAALY